MEREQHSELELAPPTTQLEPTVRLLDYAELPIGALVDHCRTIREWTGAEAWGVNHRLKQQTLVGFAPGVGDQDRAMLADSLRMVTNASQESGLHKIKNAHWLNQWGQYIELLDPTDRTVDRYHRVLLPIRFRLGAPLTIEDLGHEVERIRTRLHTPSTPSNNEQATAVQDRRYAGYYLPLLERRYQVLWKKRLYDDPYYHNPDLDKLRALTALITQDPGHTIGDYARSFQRYTGQFHPSPRLSVVSLAQMGVIQLGIDDIEVDTWRLAPVGVPFSRSDEDLVAMQELR